MSRADAALAEKARELDPGSFRYTVLSAARRFKNTWAELGKLLVQVRDGERHAEWGYPSFEAYCAKELHIRKSTAEKLLRSFSFLARHEPEEVANDNFVDKAPAFEVVEVLADAEERGQLSPQEYQSIRERIWSEDRPVAELRRELGEKFPRPDPPAPSNELLLRRLAHTARKLARELASCRGASRALIERAEALAEDIEGLGPPEASGHK